MVEKLEKNERKLKKQLKIYMKKVQDLEGMDMGRLGGELWQGTAIQQGGVLLAHKPCSHSCVHGTR